MLINKDINYFNILITKPFSNIIYHNGTSCIEIVIIEIEKMNMSYEEIYML